jgi:hypothetical protein
MGIPQVGDKVPWNEIPEFYNEFQEHEQPEPGIITAIDQENGWVYIEVINWDGEGFNTNSIILFLMVLLRWVDQTQCNQTKKFLGSST